MLKPIIVYETPNVNQLQSLRQEALDAQLLNAYGGSTAALRIIARLASIVAEQQARIEHLEQRLTEATS